MQTYATHLHRPVATVIGCLFVIAALVAFGFRWYGIWPRETFALGLLGLAGAIVTLLWISRLYITRLQDRIIKLEMRVRTAELLTRDQQRVLFGLTTKQIAALRFASDQELGALVDRAAREKLTPADIKRAVKTWTPDHDRT